MSPSESKVGYEDMRRLTKALIFNSLSHTPLQCYFCRTDTGSDLPSECDVISCAVMNISAPEFPQSLLKFAPRTGGRKRKSSKKSVVLFLEKSDASLFVNISSRPSQAFNQRTRLTCSKHSQSQTPSPSPSYRT